MGNGRTTVNILTRDFKDRLKALYSVEEVSQIIYMLFEHYMGWSKVKVHLSHDEEIPETKAILFHHALAELCTGKPVQLVLGRAWFNGYALTVNPNVLIPRPETEELCMIVSEHFSDPPPGELSILDIGTGSGCIAIDLKKRMPFARITAIDVSPDALEVARENATEHHCDLEFLRCDILRKEDRSELGQYDVIISNPPYVTESDKKMMKPNVTEFEPSLALFVPDNDPLVFYKAIADFAISHLSRPGALFFDINEQFGQETAEVLRSRGFSGVMVLPDFHGKHRFTRAVLKSVLTPPL